MLLLISILACERTPDDPGVGPGPHVLSAPEVRGELRTDGGCSIGLWGPAWGTPGMVSCTVTVDERGRWLTFPFETGLGDGAGVLELGEGTARLPLGSRDGEHDLELELVRGELEPAVRRGLAEASEQRVAGWQAAWNDGAFRLQVGDQLVGELRFEGDAVVSVATYDAHWMTEGLVRSGFVARGPDLLVQFPVMPTLQEELGLMLVNVPTGRVVVPAAAEPTKLDRWLELVPGAVGDEEAVLAARAAADAALAREREVLERLLPGLEPEERCEPPSARDGLLPGYAVRVASEEGGCVLVVEPEPVQHGRRIAARRAVDGTLTWLVRSLP